MGGYLFFAKGCRVQTSINKEKNVGHMTNILCQGATMTETSISWTMTNSLSSCLGYYETTTVIKLRNKSIIIQHSM